MLGSILSGVAKSLNSCNRTRRTRTRCIHTYMYVVELYYGSRTTMPSDKL